ncbi:hypothetical protein [Bartonella sp. DGB1]|uniref:hypothetical protein n=1 Tax=Bartonella sp. DGB1 TaxID=3239807 RepID=UPI0035254407
MHRKIEYYQQQLSFDLGYQSIYGRDNLIVSRANCSAICFLEQWPAWQTPITVLIGEQGCGKTHISNLWLEKSKAISINKFELDKGVELALSGHSIFIDNLGKSKIDEINLFHLFNAIKETFLINKTTSLLITSHYFPSTWQLTINDLISRLRTVNMIKIDTPDDLLLKGLLKKLLADRQLIIDNNMIDYILLRVERTVDKINNLVNYIDQLVIDEKKKANRNIINKAFKLTEQKN